MSSKFSNRLPEDKKRFFSFWIIRISLLILLVLESTTGRIEIEGLITIAFFLTFLPSIIRRMFTIQFPLAFELLYLLSVLVLVLTERIFHGAIVQIILGVFFGLFGFLLMYILYYNSRIQSSYKIIALFSFCFSVSIGSIWGIFLYLLKELFNISVGLSNMEGLFSIIIGATLISIVEYSYLRYGEGELIEKLLRAFIKKNPRFFNESNATSEQVHEIISQGEGEQVEFKSTLRTNLHTKKPDKKMEQAVLKTIAAFLNSDGGTLLVGVTDKGSICGIEQDGFQSKDRYYRHYTNLIKSHIGNEYFPLIKSKIIPINDASVLKIDCYPSDKEVFLTFDNYQYFYVRVGPTSVELTGKKLLEYVYKRF